MIHIRLLDERLSDAFFAYLAKHISENGINNSPLFIPFTKEQSLLPDALKKQMYEGINKNFFEPNWRKVWVAVTEDNTITGHIDIKPHALLNTEHRVIMGMGVDSAFRKRKIGERLMLFIIDFCKKNEKIEWIDLQVMAENLAAIQLYEKMNFKITGVTNDLFRIEGQSHDYISMALDLRT